ncbi:hypothetical protein LTR35_014566 [Friedmanniomyces endolithicus]|uniref:SET domain-containing protein n=1 Tax=Friedmanniomyces endolithicus TaxID=329885 RepID=A0AAN6FFQ8_9PEZI|nr:hypothetical protein LTR35_014566 [Friedmanniomyces endolithicus]KAK0274791.1 hypothetical protein LTS00_015287 [Friedmanniomyces endolithicus]KAK0316101.1 hypothetical protein LTR82_012394 [Friedmanniomyces endolithicus]KAK0985635.1 hypothetical protein LTR54_013712 [Friedmanniomyces endolithicus]
MDTYQKPLENVDAALNRLNATLASYKISSTTKSAINPIRPPAPRPVSANRSQANGYTPSPSASSSVPASRNVQQSNGHAQSAHRPDEPTPPGGEVNGTSARLFDELRRPDLLWQEALNLRFCDRSIKRTMMQGPAFPGMPGDQIAIDRQIDDIMMLQEHYLVDYPYLLPIRLLTSQKYLQLGYPDLAAGEAYKALLLCDAVCDTSDEYHPMAAPQLRDFILQLPRTERIRQLTCDPKCVTELPTGPPAEVMDIELDIWVRYHYLPWAQRLLAVGLMYCGCYKTAWYKAWQGMTSIDKTAGDVVDQWLVDVTVGCEQAVRKLWGMTDDEWKDQGHSNNGKAYPDLGCVRREVYPWNEWEPDRLDELPALNLMMAEVAPKLEVRAVELLALTGSGENATVMQLGVFAKEDIAPGEVVLSETSMLTANNKLQDALCDACSADLPELDSPEADQVCECPECKAVFCSEACLSRADATYHRATCGNDLDTLLRDVPPAEAADSLYSLLLMRAIAMADVQECHPLDLNEVRFIWGDFHNLPITPAHFTAPDLTHESLTDSDRFDEGHGKVPRTLPWSFEHNIRLPIQMLEKMEIDPFAEPNYDLWVFNTLFAKFRGTASARLSGQAGSGRRARGPEVSAVHPMWCLANHSCDPNVRWEWGGSIEFTAIEERVLWKGSGGEGGGLERRDGGIRKGEEVLNHYCDVELDVHERREWARGALGGECRCERCVWEAGQESGDVKGQ